MKPTSLTNMILYHGTSLAKWEAIKNTGLLPRGEEGQSNWKHTIESNPDSVYLTDTYAGYFAINATNAINCTTAVILELDTDDLAGELVADEDAIEQSLRASVKGKLARMSMVERTRHYRDRVREYAANGFGYEESLKALGTCGHLGPIGTSCILRAALIDTKVAKDLCWTLMDPCITTINYNLIGWKYRSLTRMIFGDEPLPWDASHPMAAIMGLPRVDRAGITVVELRGD